MVTSYNNLECKQAEIYYYDFLCNENIKQIPGNIMKSYGRICGAISKGLKNLGIESKYIPINDIIVEGKKISGNAQTRKIRTVLQHGTILLKINPELMYSALKPHPSSSYNRMVQSVRTKCIGIKKKIPNYDEKVFVDSLQKGFINELKIKLLNGSFFKSELKCAQNLIKEKYNNKKWLEKYE